MRRTGFWQMSEYSPRVLPWRDWDGAFNAWNATAFTRCTQHTTHKNTPRAPQTMAEWTATSRLLFAGDGVHRQLGVDRVQAWRARGRIPVAVDSTASLLEVCVHAP